MKALNTPKEFSFVKANEKHELHKNIIENGEVVDTIMISNFKSVITKQTTYIDHNRKENIKFTISSFDENMEKQPEIVIDASELEHLSWPLTRYGIGMDFTDGSKSKKLFIESIKYFSRNCKKEIINASTGYIDIEDKKIYLSGGATITRKGSHKKTRSTLHQRLKNYSLPSPPKSQQSKISCVQGTLEFLNISKNDPKIGALALSIIARIALSAFERIDFTIFIAGITGTKKSSVAAAILSSFGKNFSYDNLPVNWISTENSLEELILILSDTLVVIDDFKYKSSSQVSSLNVMIDRIVRSIANGSTRARLNDIDTKKTEPRALALITGEIIPCGPGIDPSMHDRICYLSLSNGDINEKKLAAIQELGKTEHLSRCMALYIQYILSNSNHAEELYRKTADKIKSSIKNKTNIAKDRVINNFSSLISSVRVYMQFAIDQNAISKDEAQKIYKTCKSSLIRLAINQHNIVSKTNILNITSQALETSLQEGACVLRDISNNDIIPLSLSSESNCPLYSIDPVTAGWLDKSTGQIYINKKFDVSILFSHAPKNIRKIIEKPRQAFWISMKKNNCLKSTDEIRGRNYFRKTIVGIQHNVYHTRFSVKH
ncbi:MAG: DUF927 domain-containing protein [Gammaproteobacteria bacterium]|nr:DUF927 domain-containing protein [Gammaproteobacteria bacterium]